MTEDIVERLRWDVDTSNFHALSDEAADEIERLRSFVGPVIANSGYVYVSSPQELVAEITRLNQDAGRLRAELKEAQDRRDELQQTIDEIAGHPRR